MRRKLTLRQRLLSILGLVYDKSYKEIGVAAAMPQKDVSHQLIRERVGEMRDEVYERLLAGIEPFPRAAVPIVTGCLEALDALEREDDLTAEERAEIERQVQIAAQRNREDFAEVARLSRAAPAAGYPEARDLAPARARAEALFRRLERLAPEARLAVVRVAEEYQTWALSERASTASVEANSRDLDAAAAWARLGREIAERVRGPEGFRRRLQGHAAAHEANVVRVAGALKPSEAALEEAKRLWLAGSDPLGVLDPGRLLDLEASLRRDQRRLPEALALLDEAAAVSHHPERILANKGFTLEVMGEYARAVETLVEALPLVERAGDPRLLYMARFNLAVNLCHLGRYGEAAALVPAVRDAAAERGDGKELSRIIWLEARIAAGEGRRREALVLLAAARREFAARGMTYDMALALLEEVALHLEEGRPAEVRVLSRELAAVFADKGVQREALAALRLFHEAAERDEATAELARRVLDFLFRARHDPGLRFSL
jgi:tetratricopeptide (TPR) repeat protein